MENSTEKIKYKISKYNVKYIKTSNQVKKVGYLSKTLDYTKQLIGINKKEIIKLDFDDQIKSINTNLDKISSSIDESNKIYNMVKQVDSGLNLIVKTTEYEKTNELVPYYLETISKIENFNL
jgi:hypothetical protein